MTIPAELIISISGIRGIAGDVMTPELAAVFAGSYANILGPGPVIVSRDSRPSGKAIHAAVVKALCERGREVLDADLIPLPTTQVAIEEAKAAGAIDVTASHNPAPYNGLKFLGPDTTFISQETLDALVQEVKDFSSEPAKQVGSVKNINAQALAWHLDHLEPEFTQGKELAVAVDAVNGAGSYIVPMLLEKIGCKSIQLANDPEQPFPHVPEPLPANLEWTQKKLQDKVFDFCAVVDPDADRLVLIDENGRLIPEEATIPLVAQSLMLSGKKGTIIINMSTSRMTEDLAERYGSQVIRSAVGEKNVVNAMQAHNAFFGAEGGGGIIDPTVHYGRDSLVGILHIVNLLRATGKALSELVDELPHYEMAKLKVPRAAHIDIKDIYRQLEERFPEANADYTDGLRLGWPDKWVHVRPSNTEPIFRLIAEAKTKQDLDRIADIEFFSRG